PDTPPANPIDPRLAGFELAELLDDIRRSSANMALMGEGMRRAPAHPRNQMLDGAFAIIKAQELLFPCPRTIPKVHISKSSSMALRAPIVTARKSPSRLRSSSRIAIADQPLACATCGTTRSRKLAGMAGR